MLITSWCFEETTGITSSVTALLCIHTSPSTQRDIHGPGLVHHCQRSWNSTANHSTYFPVSKTMATEITGDPSGYSTWSPQHRGFLKFSSPLAGLQQTTAFLFTPEGGCEITYLQRCGSNLPAIAPGMYQGVAVSVLRIPTEGLMPSARQIQLGWISLVLILSLNPTC